MNLIFLDDKKSTVRIERDKICDYCGEEKELVMRADKERAVRIDIRDEPDAPIDICESCAVEIVELFAQYKPIEGQV